MTPTASIARSDGHPISRGARTTDTLVPPHPAEVRCVRVRVLDEVLSGYDDAVVQAVLLVLSELASNAIAASPPHEFVRVAVTASRASVLVVVENRASLDTRSLSYDLPPPHRLSGRGLAVVRRLTSEFDLTSQQGLTRARAVIPVPH